MDELAIFGGQTRVLARKPKNRFSTSGAESSPSPTISPEGSVSPASAISTLEPIQVVAAPSTTAPHSPNPEYLGSQHARRLSLQQTIDATNNPDTTANPPSGKQMGEMFSSLMGYLASRSISTVNATLPVPNPIPDPYRHVQQNVSQGWDGTMEGIISGFPQADNSFGWFPPFDPQANITHQQQPSNPSNTTSTGVHPSSPRLQPHHEQTAFIPSNCATSHQYSDYESYGGSIPSAFTDPAGGMVELGSMTESEMDSGWLSFMQDCGIIMHSPPR
jgi:hypothetical protein